MARKKKAKHAVQWGGEHKRIVFMLKLKKFGYYSIYAFCTALALTCQSPTSEKSTPKGPLDVRYLTFEQWISGEHVTAAYDSGKYPFNAIVGDPTIKDLSPLSIYSNVENIDFTYLSNSQLVDFTVFSNFHKTISLKIDSKYLDNISWLAAMPNLSTFYLSNYYTSKIKDFTIIKNLLNLRSLKLNMQYLDLNNVTKLPSLDSLYLSCDTCKDIGNIEYFTNISSLVLTQIYTSDTIDFTNLTNLKNLTIEGIDWKYNNNFNYPSISNCTKLQSLRIDDPSLVNLNFVSSLAELERLNVEIHRTLTNISGLTGITNLKYLSFHLLSYSFVPSFDYLPLCSCLGQGDTFSYYGLILPTAIKDTLTNNGVILIP